MTMPVQHPSTAREAQWVVHRIEINPTDDLVQLAEVNQRLSGNWKYVLEPREDQLRLRLDTSEQMLEPGILLEPAESGEGPIVSSSAEWLSEFKTRIETLGYSCNSREDRLIVALQTWQAQVAREADGGCICSVTVSAPVSDASRQATALLLLRAGGCVRVARGFLTGPPQTKAGFMSRIAPGASDDQVAIVLEAMTVCCHHFAKSISVLENEHAAKRYLALSATFKYHSQHQLKGELQTC